jgi:hypothetical protein
MLTAYDAASLDPYKRGHLDAHHNREIDESRAVLFPGDRQDLLLQSGRQKEPGLSAQCHDLRLYPLDLAIALGAEQHSQDARDSQSGALGRATSVPLVQQDHIRGQFQCQRDGLGLTGIENGREQSRDMVLSKHPRFDPTVLESLLDLLQRCWVGELVEFRLDSAWNPDLLELAPEKT